MSETPGWLTLPTMVHREDLDKAVAAVKDLRAALDRAEAEKAAWVDNGRTKIFDHKWLDPQCIEMGCQSLILRAALDRAKAEKVDFRRLDDAGYAEIVHLRAELAAARSVLIRVDEWWTSLPYGLRQDIEGSGAVPGCIAAVLTALQSHRRTEETT